MYRSGLLASLLLAPLSSAAQAQTQLPTIVVTTPSPVLPQRQPAQGASRDREPGERQPEREGKASMARDALPSRSGIMHPRAVSHGQAEGDLMGYGRVASAKTRESAT